MVKTNYVVALGDDGHCDEAAEMLILSQSLEGA